MAQHHKIIFLLRPPPNSHILNPSLVVTFGYSIPILFLLLDDTHNEYVREIGMFVREMSGNCQGNPSSRFGRQPEEQVLVIR